MIIVKEINEYIEYTEKYPEKINKKRQLLIKNIVKPLLERDDVFFDAETFDNCIKYCEANYYPLFPYQKFIYAFVFMYVNDIPLYGTIFVEMGRGNGKDGFMMPLANFLQTPLYGIKNYNVDIVANNEEQAKDSYDVVYDMLDGNRKFKGKFYVSKEKIFNYATKSRLRYNTSNAKTKDGKKGGLILFNEYHAYEDNSQIDVFTSQRGKIKHPRTIIITTNGYVRGGPLDDLIHVCDEIIETGVNEIGYFPFMCEIDCIEEVDKKECWVKANPSIEFMPVLRNEIERAYLEMKKFPTKRAEFITKRMNFPQRNDDVTVASWDNILRASYSDIKKLTIRQAPNLEDRLAVVGIDYADIRDFASAGFLFKIDGEYIWRQHTWICSQSPFFVGINFPFKNAGLSEYEDFELVDSSSLSPSVIVEWILEEMKKYSVQKIVMDTYRFNMFKKAFEERNISIETKQNPYGMIRMIRYQNSINALNAPVIEKAFSDGLINIGGSSIMRWYINNTSVKIDKFGNKQYGKIEPKLRKNDGFMALVVAMSVESLLDELVISV